MKKHFRDLPDVTIQKLNEIVLKEQRYRPRLRAQSLLFSHKGLSAIQIAEIMGLNLDKLYRWWRLFEKGGVNALYDKEGKGAKKKIQAKDEEIIKQALTNQLTLNGVMAEIDGRTTVAFSKQTLQRHCKVMNYTYKRLRFSPPKEPDETLYAEKKTNSEV